MGGFYFYYCVQKFSAYNFFWVNFFAYFSTDCKAVSSFVFYDTHNKIYIHFRSGRLYLCCKKKSKSLYPNVHILHRKEERFRSMYSIVLRTSSFFS
jgi:hypothetical protein